MAGDPWMYQQLTEKVTPENSVNVSTRSPQDDDEKLIDFNNPTILALVIVAGVLLLITLLVVIYLCLQSRKSKSSTTESDRAPGNKYKKSKKLTLTKTVNDTNTFSKQQPTVGTQGFVPKGNVQLKDNKNSSPTTIDTTIATTS